MVIAIYILLVYLTQSFSFGQYQIRIATGLYALAYHMPFLTLPLAIANMLSNILFGGLGLLDMIGGGLVGFLTCSSILLLKKLNLTKIIVVSPIAILIPICVPVWLSYILQIPYHILFISIAVGQIISAYTLGYAIVQMKFKDIA